MIKVASANFYVGNPHPQKAAHILAAQGADINGIQEGHSGNVPAIRKALGKSHKVIVTGGSIDRLDVPIVLQKDVKVIKSWGRRISKRSSRKNIGMPRAVTVVRFKRGGDTYTFLNTHTNAAVQNRNTRRVLSTKIRRVAEYAAGMVVLEAMIRAAHKRGDYVILTGDLNYRVGGGWKFAPENVFKRTGLDFKNVGLDYIAYSRDLKPSRFKVINNQKATGADHPWLFLNLTPKKR